MMLRSLLISLFGASSAFALVAPSDWVADADCVLQLRAGIAGGGVFSCPQVLCNDATDCRLNEVEYQENYFWISCGCSTYSPLNPCYAVGQRWLDINEGWMIDWECHKHTCPVNCTYLEPPWPVVSANCCDC